ncbi:transmembrane protein 87B-like [Eucalyptus grandis]|uniref:transmembrane protein 87B-like n=1 Tax=Eucalyptus grandis TaxID=71139 RepID=UPI00192E970B|nr:transmembrane protein 87B-like [Eucalyptus grandis]
MEVRESRRAQRRLGFFCLVAALVSIATVDASVHNYFNEAFTSRSNAFFFHSGSEGLRTPRSAIPPSSSTTLSPNITTGPKGKSFIRCGFLHFGGLLGTIIKGRTVWRNPSGYLPGKMVPLMVVFGLMSLAYLVLGLIWFLKFVQHWKDVIQLHYHITAVIALGMCESALWYFEYSNLNSTGRRPMGITMWAVTFTAVKTTFSRLLLLVVSMGYGVVRPTLGGITSRVLFGGAYRVASESYELVEHLGNINDFSGKTALFLVLLVRLLDACFILWIFSSLSKTLEQLQVLVLCLLG